MLNKISMFLLTRNQNMQVESHNYVIKKMNARENRRGIQRHWAMGPQDTGRGLTKHSIGNNLCFMIKTIWN